MRKTLFASLLRYDAFRCRNGWTSDGPWILNDGRSYGSAQRWTAFTWNIKSPPPPVCCRQDVAFFDANKTGQLVNRLTADIQEFKSSFKLVISQVWAAEYWINPISPRTPLFHPLPHLQGLRSVTQTAGCFVSLYIISPQLTGLTVVVLPSLVGAGALFGSFLRKLSRLAQEQVMKEPVNKKELPHHFCPCWYPTPLILVGYHNWNTWAILHTLTPNSTLEFTSKLI